MLLLTSACASEPAYAPPTSAEAKAAVARSIRADLIDGPRRRTPAGPTALSPDDTPAEAQGKVGAVLYSEAEVNDRAAAPRRIASLSRVELGECQWGSIDPDDVRPYGRDRVEGIAEGYTCQYEIFHRTAERGLVSATGEGFFFHREGSYDFAGSEQSSFERVADR